MSQIFAKPKKYDTNLIQDIYFAKKESFLSTNVSLASCYVCNKGLKEERSLCAKIISGEMVLLCNIHRSKN